MLQRSENAPNTQPVKSVIVATVAVDTEHSVGDLI